MRRRLLFLPLVALVCVLALPLAARAATTYAVDTPSARPHAIEGQDERFLLGGSWLVRLDPTDAGL
ncbi:MAG: hypothetical protein ACTHOE_09620, partial [Conexibacter sp.]